ncbi:MAG: 2-amino-4-hydroxy-6-hydroxymethyldihydropteridine diphosphokinase [Chloroflexi bacterium]|nr:2-amino-4-hydroxy-6-hydroxymethyldihydropteridine diphosphokinase [Chloroflexota bacterium]MYF78567.1 2-amino-4-hydroxy-6-hydroxymethyldihydropteridine diphosphokinase [Chloroflexota bacterium]MYK62199.1 2-amino-4-hydroxy-6-hydroxymethyldihydropteridine diphosphokinase [Chloroflexota bacterium]
MVSNLKPNIAYIGLGSNLGDRVAYLRSAVNAIQHLGDSMSISSIYESEPFGVGDEQQPMYLNMAVSIKTILAPEQLLSKLMDIECANGRVRIRKNEPRSLDLDVLMFGDKKIETPALSVPHPRMHERAFVMLPLAEIAPHSVHPVLQRTISEIAAGIPCQGVRRIGEYLPLSRIEGGAHEPKSTDIECAGDARLTNPV